MTDIVKRRMDKVGRPNEQSMRIGNVRLLTAQELELARHKRGKDPAAKRFRDSHHMMARLFAMGLRTSVIAEQTGYSLTRVGMLRSDAAFQELIAHYREDVNGAWKAETNDYFAIASRSRTKAARMIEDRLEATDETGDESHLSAVRTLLAVQDSFADRTGYPKRTVATNVNIDFAAMLDRAIERSDKAREPKVIEHEPIKGLRRI